MNILKKNIGTNQQMNKEYSIKKIFAGGQFQIYIHINIKLMLDLMLPKSEQQELMTKTKNMYED